VAPGVQPELAGVRRSKHLQRQGALHFGVFLRGHLEKIIGTQIQHNELSSFRESKSVSAGFQRLATNLEGHFGNEVGLALFFDAGRVARIVERSSQHVAIICKMYAAAVAYLHRRGLAAKENSLRHQLWRDFSGFKDNVFSIGRGISNTGGTTNQWKGSKNAAQCQHYERTTKHRPS